MTSRGAGGGALSLRGGPALGLPLLFVDRGDHPSVSALGQREGPPDRHRRPGELVAGVARDDLGLSHKGDDTRVVVRRPVGLDSSHDDRHPHAALFQSTQVASALSRAWARRTSAGSSHCAARRVASSGESSERVSWQASVSAAASATSSASPGLIPFGTVHRDAAGETVVDADEVENNGWSRSLPSRSAAVTHPDWTTATAAKQTPRRLTVSMMSLSSRRPRRLWERGSDVQPSRPATARIPRDGHRSGSQ